MYYGSDPVGDGVYTHMLAIFLFFLCIIIFLYVYYYHLRLAEWSRNRARNRPKHKQQPSKQKDAGRKNGLRTYLVRTRCVDLQKNQLEQNDPIYEFEAQFDDKISLVALADAISERVSEHRRGSNYAVDEFKIKGFTFGVTENEKLGDYIRLPVISTRTRTPLTTHVRDVRDGDSGRGTSTTTSSTTVPSFQSRHRFPFPYQEGSSSYPVGAEKYNLEVYCVFGGLQKGYQFQNMEDEALAQLVPNEQAPEFIANMNPGALIQADCPHCVQRILKQVRLFKNRTGTFDLKKGVRCPHPQCKLHIADLLSPVFSACEYNYDGERDGTPVNEIGWRTVPLNHILYWMEDEEYNQQIQQIVEWTELKIYVRLFEKRYCTACNQKLEGQDDDEIEERCTKGSCGHRYHRACFKQVSQSGKGYCVAEGCKLILMRPRYCTACNQKIEGEDDDEIEERCAKGKCGHRYHRACFKQISQGGKGQCVAEGCQLILVEAMEE